MSADKITIPQPDDWHLHLRDVDLLAGVLPATIRDFRRALVMPNLLPPIRDAAAARAYRARIRALLPRAGAFEPLMSCYLTDATTPDELRAGAADGSFIAAKLYPAGATTNAEAGVTAISRVYRVFETMQDLGLPLLLHGETADPEVDVFDREAVFVDTVLGPLRRDFPALKIVLEHVTTREGVQFVRDAPGPTAATVTPHHLTINRNAMFDRGFRPHMYCLPVAKREEHRRALRAAAVSGNPRFFLGTDSAPHLRARKEHDCGCAGIFNAPTALACYAQVFDEEGHLDRLADFASRFGAAFYGLPAATGELTLERCAPETAPDWPTPLGPIRVFTPPGGLRWRRAVPP